MMALAAHEFGWLCDFVRLRSGMVLEPGKEYLAETRLLSLAHDNGFGSVGHLLAALRANDADGMGRLVVEAMTVNETSFFRDHQAFMVLRRSVLPEILDARAAERRLSIWCAGCSSGQEPYSVAILLRETFPGTSAWKVEILGTDLCAAMLARAQAGIYSQIEVNRGLPAVSLLRWFKPRGLDWQIAEELRQTVTFRHLNLARPWPALPGLDLILLRNVLIYFDDATRQSVLARVRRALREDGWLLLGAAETISHVDNGFFPVVRDGIGFYRRS